MSLFSVSSAGPLLPEGYPKLWLHIEGLATLGASAWAYSRLEGGWCVRSAYIYFHASHNNLFRLRLQSNDPEIVVRALRTAC